MQNRYTGDIGDFGKLGLLRALRASGLSIGVNWYLVPDEGHNKDGKHTDYPKLRECDKALFQELNSIVAEDRRRVCELQKKSILDAVFYSEELDFSGKTRSQREELLGKWHEAALGALDGVDIVFADPDNGLLVPSACGTKKENKYVLPAELRDYYGNGSSVIYYQHRARRSDSFYLEQHKELLNRQDEQSTESWFPGASSLCLKFFKTSHRYYFFIIQPRHKDLITKAVNGMLASGWDRCFQRLPVTKVFFIRHAEPNLTNHNDMLRELSPKGMADRAFVTRFLADKDISAVLSSPYKRAVDTVADFAEKYGFEIEIDADFRERRVADGWIDNFTEFSEKQWADFDYRLEDGESLSEVQKRNIAALSRALEKYAGKNIVIGSHGTALSTIINYYDKSFGYKDFERIRGVMPWIVEFSFDEDGNCINIKEYLNQNE